MRKKLERWKLIEKVATDASIALACYLFISFIQVNSCNLAGKEIAIWNFFRLFS